MKIKRFVKKSFIYTNNSDDDSDVIPVIKWYVEKDIANKLYGYTEALEKAAILGGHDEYDINLVDYGYDYIDVYFQRLKDEDWVDVKNIGELSSPVEIPFADYWVLRDKPDKSKKRFVFIE